MDQILRVFYPSGSNLRLFGRFDKPINVRGRFIVPIDLLESTMIGGDVCSAGSVVCIDPRCIVTDENGKVLYDPNQWAKHLNSDMRRWLKKHQNWNVERLIRNGRL